MARVKKVLPKEWNSNYYQANKERLKAKRRENHQLKKKQKAEELDQYYSTHSIKVLLNFKQYTEINKQTQKLWLDLDFVLRKLNQGINSIEEIMRLEQLVSQLIKDYWERTKSKERKESESWNVLTPEEQKKLIKFWGREEARKKKKLASTLNELEQEGESYEKEIELAKFHEERGKIKCECYSCQQANKDRKEMTERFGKFYEEPKPEKIECGECKKLVALSSFNEEAGACKPCVKRINN